MISPLHYTYITQFVSIGLFAWISLTAFSRIFFLCHAYQFDSHTRDQPHKMLENIKFESKIKWAITTIYTAWRAISCHIYWIYTYEHICVCCHGNHKYACNTTLKLACSKSRDIYLSNGIWFVLFYLGRGTPSKTPPPLGSSTIQTIDQTVV